MWVLLCCVGFSIALGTLGFRVLTEAWRAAGCESQSPAGIEESGILLTPIKTAQRLSLRCQKGRRGSIV